MSTHNCNACRIQDAGSTEIRLVVGVWIRGTEMDKRDMPPTDTPTDCPAWEPGSWEHSQYIELPVEAGEVTP